MIFSKVFSYMELKFCTQIPYRHSYMIVNLRYENNMRKIAKLQISERTNGYYRYQRKKHINRKKRIIHKMNDYWYYKYEGKLSKGKIHCSCWKCRRKSYEERSRKDKVRLNDMKQQLNDVNFD